MDIEVCCPTCGTVRIPFASHLGLIVLGPSLGIYRFACPSCGGVLAVPCGIPAPEQAAARHALAAAGADDGRRTWPDAIASWYSALAAWPWQEGRACDAGYVAGAGVSLAHEEWDSRLDGCGEAGRGDEPERRPGFRDDKEA